MTSVADVSTVASPLVSAVYRRSWVPDDAAFPYVSVLDPIADTPILSGDARTLARRRLLQVDLWQDLVDEDDDLPGALAAALDGLEATDGGRYRVTDVALVVGEEDEDDIVHHSITVSWARVV